MDLDVILNLDTLPAHEEALRLKMLQVLTRDSEEPNSAHTFFVSQNWEEDNHPDNDEGTKLAWLKNINPHLRIRSGREIWIWLDYYSIPRKNRQDQLKAIMSLPHYMQLCTSILPLVRDARRRDGLGSVLTHPLWLTRLHL